jgi:ATP-dependent protease ClpP protease subunit
MSDIKDSIEQFHDKGICYATKTIEMFGDIDVEMRNRVVKNLHILDQKTGEITILLSSEGGNVNIGLEIIDTIKNMKNYVRIVASGEVSSMASVIFQAGDRRCMRPNSFLMLHEGTAELQGKQKDRDQWKKLQDWQENTCNNIYLSRIKEKKPRYSKKKLLENMDKDWVIFPKEAVELGLADNIMENTE